MMVTWYLRGLVKHPTTSLRRKLRRSRWTRWARLVRSKASVRKGGECDKLRFRGVVEGHIALYTHHQHNNTMRNESSYGMSNMPEYQRHTAHLAWPFHLRRHALDR